jgi:hypothetical protein
MDMFDPVVTGVGIADAGYADAQPDMSESIDEEVVTAATGYNDIGPDATVDEVSFDAAT